MYRRVIGKRKGWDERYPVQGVISHSCQIFLNGFVYYFHLGVTLRVSRGGFVFGDIERFTDVV
jgi:hypothetical protein